MKKKIKKNFRVVVEPEISPYTKDEILEEVTMDDCNEMKLQIERHIDNIDSVEVLWDTKEICSFCGYDWEIATESDCEGDDYIKVGMPLCCIKAQEEFIKLNNEEE